MHLQINSIRGSIQLQYSAANVSHSYDHKFILICKRSNVNELHWNETGFFIIVAEEHKHSQQSGFPFILLITKMQSWYHYLNYFGIFRYVYVQLTSKIIQVQLHSTILCENYKFFFLHFHVQCQYMHTPM